MRMVFVDAADTVRGAWRPISPSRFVAPAPYFVPGFAVPSRPTPCVALGRTHPTPSAARL